MSSKIKKDEKKLEDDIKNLKAEINVTRSGFRKYFHDIFDIRDDMMSYNQINEMMQENTVIHGSKMWILIMAIFIASIGLNVNSTAVIIGAMLISPLMSGIMTMGYSIAVRDIGLFLKALRRFGTQVGISLLTSTVYFLITPLDTATSEMIARTSPTLWDVLIALFGGIAGMIGNSRKTKGNIIPGVAIATALMPPLCTAGYGIATGQPAFFGGAFYLFLINTIFISLSTALVTLILKVPPHRELSEKKQKHINVLVALISVLTVIPSIYIGAVTVYDSYLERNINSYLKNEFVFQNSQVVKSSTDTENRHISVSLVGEIISDEKISEIEDALSFYGLDGYTVKITQNHFDLTLPDTEEIDKDKLTIAIQENTISDLQKKLDESNAQIDELRKIAEGFENEKQKYAGINILSSKLPEVFTYLSECSCGIMNDGISSYIMMTAQAEHELTENEIMVIENYIRTESGFNTVKTDIKTVVPEPEEEKEADAQQENS